MALRALKKAETRELLIRSARELFHRCGYEETTVDDIASLAGVSQRTFFRYFGSKLEAAFPYHKARVERMRELIEHHFDPANPVRSVREALRDYSLDYQACREELLQEYALVRASTLLAAKDLELDSHFESLIADTFRRGGMSHLEAAVLAGAIFGASRAATAEWLTNACGESLLKLGRPTLQLIDTLARAYEQKPGLFEALA